MAPVPVPPLDDAAARAVWADLLAEQGHPRGELAQLQLAREQRPADARLARAEAGLLAREGRALLGPLRHATSLLSLTWRRGSVVEAAVHSEAFNTWAPRREVVEVKRPPLARRVRELLALDAAQELSALTVALRRSAFAREVLLACVEVVAVTRPPALRALRVHVLDERFDDWDSEGWFAGETAQAEVGGVVVIASVELFGPVVATLG